MLKNISMRILALAFAFAFTGCVDSDETNVGVDDIEEQTDNFGPDVLKGDVEEPGREPKSRDINDLTVDGCGPAGITCNPGITTNRPDLQKAPGAQPARFEPGRETLKSFNNTPVTVNQVPQR